MTISQFDPTKIRVRSGDAFIAAYPITNPGSDLTPANVIKGFFALFYADGAKKKLLIDGMAKFASIDAKGFILENKFKNVAYDQAKGLPINAGKYLESCTCGMNIGDISAAKFADILSATANEQLTIAPGVGQAGKIGIMMGTQPYNNRYVLMYRWPSPNFPGEYDHVLVPRVYFEADAKMEFLKTKAQDLALKVVAEDDLYLISPDSGYAASSYYEETTAAATPAA
jgi:hypothetical protein